jgi:hypothetical protein
MTVEEERELEVVGFYEWWSELQGKLFLCLGFNRYRDESLLMN